MSEPDPIRDRTSRAKTVVFVTKRGTIVRSLAGCLIIRIALIIAAHLVDRSSAMKRVQLHDRTNCSLRSANVHHA